MVSVTHAEKEPRRHMCIRTISAAAGVVWQLLLY